MAYRNPDTIYTTLDKIAEEINSAQTLVKMLSGLKAFNAECPEDGPHELKVRGVDITDLPVFGGLAPANTSGIWSWDADNLLVGSCIADFRIVARGDES